MEKREVNKVSTRRDVFGKIASAAPRPIGIVLFGADKGSKTKLYVELSGLPLLAVSYGGENDYMGLRGAKRSLRWGINTLTMLPEQASDCSKRRRLTVEALKDMGAATVVGVYAKGGGHELLEAPSETEGYDYLVVVNDEKGE